MSIELTRDGGDYLLRASLVLTLPLERVFPFFSAAENLARITPPELGFVVRTPPPIEMRRGALIDYTVRLWGIPLPWRTEITKWDPPHEFEDTQLRGPYAKWIHRHRFRSVDGGHSTAIDDEVRYRLPLGAVGRLAHPLVRRQLRRIFAFRQLQVEKLLRA